VAAADRSAERLRGWLTGSAARRIGELEADRIRLLAEVADREAIRRENELLRAVVALRGEGEAGGIPARAVAFLREGREEFLILDRGAADGLGVGDIVLDQNRVFGGTVIAVAERSARVILLSSPSRSTDVILPNSNLRAIARGANSRELSIELVPTDAAVHSGDLVLASSRATGGRRALLVGEIREARQAEHEPFMSVRAVHLFDPATEGVLVLLAP
jgi:rod shape-determining protein MreC